MDQSRELVSYIDTNFDELYYLLTTAKDHCTITIDKYYALLKFLDYIKTIVEEHGSQAGIDKAIGK